jgi:hypothetical protein
MPFTTNYTPYAATGQLATAAGIAQQKVRDQQYAEAERARQEEIAANQAAQAKSIAAQRELQTQQLLQQQKQFNATQALNQQQMTLEAAAKFGSITSATAAAELNRMTDRDKINLAEQEFEANQEQQALENKYKVKKFELEEAATSRAAERQDLADERQSMLDLEGIKMAKIGAEGQALVLENWKELEGELTPMEYGKGLVTIANGGVPELLTEKSLTAKQQLDEQNRQTTPFTDNDITTYTKLAENLMGAYYEEGKLTAPEENPGRPTLTEAEIGKRYNDFKKQTGYDARNSFQKEQLENIFDSTVSRIGTAIGDPDEYPWNPKRNEVQTASTSARLAATIGVSVPKTVGQTIDVGTANKIGQYTNWDRAATEKIMQDLGYVNGAKNSATPSSNTETLWRPNVNNQVADQFKSNDEILWRPNTK